MYLWDKAKITKLKTKTKGCCYKMLYLEGLWFCCKGELERLLPLPFPVLFLLPPRWKLILLLQLVRWVVMFFSWKLFKLKTKPFFFLFLMYWHTSFLFSSLVYHEDQKGRTWQSLSCLLSNSQWIFFVIFFRDLFSRENDITCFKRFLSCLFRICREQNQSWSWHFYYFF